MKYLLLVAGLTALSVQAPAATIDFSTWAAADGQASYALGGVTLSTNFGTLAVDSSGVGVNAGRLDYDRDEINSLEVLTVTFDVPTTIDQIVIESLYPNEGIFFPSSERGQYRVNGGSWQTFIAQNASGQLAISNLLPDVSTLDFRPNNASIINVRDDFSLHSVNPVPEPATWGMMVAGFGLAVIGLKRRS